MPPTALRRAAAVAFWVCAAAARGRALGPATGGPSLGWDKANHVLAFAVLCGLGIGAWPRAGARLAVALLAYGIAIELLQALVPAREADALDVVADAAGIALAGLVAAAVRRWRRPR